MYSPPPSTDLGLAAHRVDGDDRPGELDQLEQLGMAVISLLF
jgi:hypothetical protein